MMVSDETKKRIELMSDEEIEYEINLGRRSHFQRESFAYLQTVHSQKNKLAKISDPTSKTSTIQKELQKLVSEIEKQKILFDSDNWPKYQRLCVEWGDKVAPFLELGEKNKFNRELDTIRAVIHEPYLPSDFSGAPKENAFNKMKSISIQRLQELKHNLTMGAASVEKVKEQILKTIYRNSDGGKKSAYTPDIRVAFDNLEHEAFFDLVIDLVNEGMISERGRGWVAFTPDGLDVATKLLNLSHTVNYNQIYVGSAVNSPILQGNNSKLHQTINSQDPNNNDLHMLVELFRTSISELGLTPNEEKKVNAQIATIEAQLLDDPNPSIINEAGKTIKNITEGAIGSLLATAAQPGVWDAIYTILSKFQ